jgi:hypothetical protein
MDDTALMVRWNRALKNLVSHASQGLGNRQGRPRTENRVRVKMCEAHAVPCFPGLVTVVSPSVRAISRPYEMFFWAGLQTQGARFLAAAKGTSVGSNGKERDLPRIRLDSSAPRIANPVALHLGRREICVSRSRSDAKPAHGKKQGEIGSPLDAVELARAYGCSSSSTVSPA